MTERQREIAEKLLSDIEQAEPGRRQAAVGTYRDFMVACEVAIRNEKSKNGRRELDPPRISISTYTKDIF